MDPMVDETSQNVADDGTDVRPEDSASQFSSSKVSSVREFQMRAAAKRAALSARADAMKSLQELQLQEFQCKQQREYAELQLQLAEAEAENLQCNVMTGGESVCSKSVDQDDSRGQPTVDNMLNPNAAEWISPDSQRTVSMAPSPDRVARRYICSEDEEVQLPAVASKNINITGTGAANTPVVSELEIIRLINQGQQQQHQMLETLQMPQAELSPYEGDPMQYWQFVRAFDNNVGSLPVDDSKKLTRLLHYCRGKALTVIQCCASMEPKVGYAKARKLLEERFGNRYLVAEAWIAKITEGPQISGHDSEGLQEFADSLRCCMDTLEAMNSTQEVNVQRVLLKIVERLPVYLQIRWRKTVRDIRRKNDKMPDIRDLVSFVSDAAEETNDPVYGKLGDRGKTKTGTEPHMKPKFKHAPMQAANTSFKATTFANIGGEEMKKCPLCGGIHPLFKCKEFIDKKLEDRLKIARDNGLCFNCLSGKHLATNCKSHWNCLVSGCGKKHNTLLHRTYVVRNPTVKEGQGEPANSTSVETDAVATCSSIGAGAGSSKVALPIVPVLVGATSGNDAVATYALLDSGSTNTFCSAALLQQLGISGVKARLSLTTLDRTDSVVETERVNLKVSDVDRNNFICLHSVYVRSVLPVHLGNLAQPCDWAQWPHLSDIDIPSVDVNNVSLLIGQDAPVVLEPHEVRRGETGAPYAVKTLLGWTLNGPLSHTAMSQKASVHFVCSDTQLEQQVRQFWEMEGGEMIADNKSMSVNDSKVIEGWNDSVQLVDNHYELPIPFKAKPPDLPNNRQLTEKRLNLLQHKLLSDPVKSEKYRKVMQEMIDKGHAEKVPKDEIQHDDGAVWYLPHHGVSSLEKPDKLRIVFDCSAKYGNISLNDQVLQGPDLSNSLAGVLLRFRQDSVAMIADIECMFHQVRVRPSDRDVLRFLWWSNGEMNQEPEDFRMTVHLFGGVWSPSCANFALRRTAEDNETEFDAKVVECVKRNFYVDDFLKSVGSSQIAVQLINDLTQLLSRGGFRLTKWMSNCRDVIETIDEGERTKEIVGLDLSCEKLPIERALGIVWDVETDSLGYRAIIKDKPHTRRGMLSIISSVYDPLGLLSPCILPAKMIVQELCRRNVGWDMPAPVDVIPRWLKWLEQLPVVEQIKVNRCINPFGACVAEFSLHHFCDASQVGYGVASYLRSVDANGNASCCLLMAKSRLAPLKTVTIPRLELSAAALAVKLDEFIRSELDFAVRSFFWTDSAIVLAYIRNVDKRFKTFVANRVSLIHNGSTPSQWRHVRTEWNPADDVSRGLTFEELKTNQRWFHGPDFLVEFDENLWPIMPENPVGIDNLETKAKSACVLLSYEVSGDVMNRLFHRYSDFYLLKKSVAWILVLIKQLYYRIKGMQLRNMKEKLTVDELQKAEIAILKYVQGQSFTEEITALKSQQAVRRSSSTYRLSPMIRDDDLLCIEGRLRNSNLSASSKHQVILPSKHPVTSLIIDYFHQQSGHAGREFVLSLIREKYWIISGRQAVRQVLKRCVTCRRLYSRPVSQKMADLPSQRITSDKPPFSYVGVDFFGPFYVKSGRSQAKRYGCIFTCMTVRAVHIEVANSLEADSFINALQRFISRRGQPLEMLSDNGTNFVGGCRELQRAAEAWNSSKMQEVMRQKEIRWKFNPPAASHMGGIWERQIRTIRKLLSALMNQQQLTDEALHTLLCIVENIINSRPLTVISDDPADLEPLTPNHILHLRSGPSLPPGEFVKQDLYCRRRWRQVQYLANVFWTRWTKEYLPTLQLRSKWLQNQDNVKVNSVVLVVDDSLPRNCWLLGRVVRTMPGSDGLVRCVEIKTKCGMLVRPVHKVCLLESESA